MYLKKVSHQHLHPKIKTNSNEPRLHEQYSCILHVSCTKCCLVFNFHKQTFWGTLRSFLDTQKIQGYLETFQAFVFLLGYIFSGNNTHSYARNNPFQRFSTRKIYSISLKAPKQKFPNQCMHAYERLEFSFSLPTNARKLL